jgi:hypothetical protein
MSVGVPMGICTLLIVGFELNTAGRRVWARKMPKPVAVIHRPGARDPHAWSTACCDEG